MRRICSSSSTSQSSALSARADSRSWPNGFSITTWAFSVRPGLAEAVDDGGEERGRDLEVEDRVLGVAERLADPLEGGGVGVVALDVGEAGGEAGEDVLVGLGDGGVDRVAGVLAQLLVVPVVDRDADDRAVELAARLAAGRAPGRSFSSPGRR